MKDKLIIIGGPTAVGKSDISISVAKKIGGEIISCDSMQIYKYMDIGSAKITEDDMNGIPHYMIDIIHPKDSFSVAEFKQIAQEHIKAILARGKIPMLVGGTGLYIDSIICNYDFTDANKDEEYRIYLQNLAVEKGNEYLYNMLLDVDKISAERLHPNNLKRIIRALEVYKITNKPFSEFEIDEAKKYDIPYDLNYFVLNMNREVLYNRINYRVDLMLESGLLEEVEKLKNMGCTSEMQSMKGIGYKELLYYLEGKMSFEEAVAMIKQGSRNYAKRQLTWFRKDSRVTWIEKEKYQDDVEIANFISEKICE